MAPISPQMKKDSGNITCVFGQVLTETYNSNSGEDSIYSTNSTEGAIFNSNSTQEEQAENEYGYTYTSTMTRLDEFQIIKAVVLASVTLIILLSICKMVLQLVVRYTVKQDKC